jgi:hypothetical protein
MPVSPGNLLSLLTDVARCSVTLPIRIQAAGDSVKIVGLKRFGLLIVGTVAVFAPLFPSSVASASLDQSSQCKALSTLATDYGRGYQAMNNAGFMHGDAAVDEQKMVTDFDGAISKLEASEKAVKSIPKVHAALVYMSMWLKSEVTLLPGYLSVPNRSNMIPGNALLARAGDDPYRKEGKEQAIFANYEIKHCGS